MKSPQHHEEVLVKTWLLPYAATLGSSVRKQGIFLEIRAQLPVAAKRLLTIVAGELVLAIPATAGVEFEPASRIVSRVLDRIEDLPVIPREVEDILQISTTERHRWLKDGRLPSVGTRTVKLRGRTKAITFHVFDPRVVEDVLDRDLVSNWREQDAETAAENRRRAAWKAKRTRSQNTGGEVRSNPETKTKDGSGAKLLGWDEFEREGPR